MSVKSLQENTLLAQIKNFLLDKAAKDIHLIEKDFKVLHELFDGYKTKGFFGIYVPTEYGGQELSQSEMVEFQTTMGYWCSTLAFLQAQTGIASYLLKKSFNEKVKTDYLKALASGNLTLGNATTQMKKQSKQYLYGETTSEGFYIEGNLPFVSGYGLFDEIVIGFFCGDKEIFALVPLYDNQKGLKLGNTLHTACCVSMNTVTMQFDRYFIPKTKTIVEWPMYTFSKEYENAIPFAYPLGLSLKALEAIRAHINKNSTHELKSYRYLENQRQTLYHQLSSNKKLTKVEKQQLFSKIIFHSWRCIQFALIFQGGASLMDENKIYRLYREMLIWLVPRKDILTSYWHLNNIPLEGA